MARALSVLYWLMVVVIAAPMFVIALLIRILTIPFDRRRVVLHAFTNFWGSLYTWINPVWTVQVRGREHLDSRRPAVLVSNHLSLVDIFLMHRLFRHFKWVSKAENFRIPFIGWNMTLNGYVPVRRGDRPSVVEMFTRCREALAQGSSVMMFPEGTRSRDGHLRPFKPGAFELAKEVRVPVVPLVVEGTFGALRARSFIVVPARMRVTVLPAIGVDEVAALSVDQLCGRARECIADRLSHSTPSKKGPKDS